MEEPKLQPGENKTPSEENTNSSTEATVNSAPVVSTPPTPPTPAPTNSEQSSSETTPVQNNENGHRVLLVEDDQFLRELLDRKLKAEGFNVQTAIEGESALVKVKEFKPEIVLLDIILPGTDGFSILEQIKADQELSQIPVVMLSNLGQKDDVDKGMKLGAVGYLVKAHFTPGDIVAKVNEILKLK